MGYMTHQQYEDGYAGLWWFNVEILEIIFMTYKTGEDHIGMAGIRCSLWSDCQSFDGQFWLCTYYIPYLVLPSREYVYNKKNKVSFFSPWWVSQFGAGSNYSTYHILAEFPSFFVGSTAVINPMFHLTRTSFIGSPSQLVDIHKKIMYPLVI